MEWLFCDTFLPGRAPGRGLDALLALKKCQVLLALTGLGLRGSPGLPRALLRELGMLLVLVLLLSPAVASLTGLSPSASHCVHKKV